MNQTVFEYRHHVPGNDSSSYPAADVLIRGADGHWRPFILYIDSGAHLTILSASDALHLKIKLTDGKPLNLYGVSGSTKAYIHMMPIKIAKRELKAEVAFSISDDTPRLLGRSDIFRFYVVSFRESRRQTIFTEEPTNLINLNL